MARLTPLWQQNGSYPASLDRRLLGALWPSGAVTGMAPSVSPATMNLVFAMGAAAVPDANVPGASYLCPSDAAETVAIGAAPPSGQDRIDVVAIQPRDSAVSGANNDWVWNVIAGTPAASPVAPAVPAGQLAMAQIRVVGGSASLVAANLVDRRPAFGQQVGVPSGRIYAAAQTIAASGTEQPIALAGTNYLYGGMTRQTIGQRDCLVIPLTGVYLVTCSVGWQVSNGPIPASQQTFTELWRNNAETRRWFTATNWNAVPVCAGSDFLLLNATDVLDLRGFQSTGTNAGSWPDSGRTYLSATLVSTGP